MEIKNLNSMPKSISNNPAKIKSKIESWGYILQGTIKTETVYSKKRMSQEILHSNIPMTHWILLYYSQAHQCSELMNELSSKTRYFWNKEICKFQSLLKSNFDINSIDLWTELTNDFKNNAYLFKSYIIKVSIYDIEQMVKKMKRTNDKVLNYQAKINSLRSSINYPQIESTKGSSPIYIKKIYIHKKEQNSQDVYFTQVEFSFDDSGKNVLMNLCKLARLWNAKPLNAKCKTVDKGEVDCADFGKAIEFTDFWGISITDENRCLKIIAMNILNKVILDEFYIDHFLELNSIERPNVFTSIWLMDLFDHENVRFKYLGMSNWKVIYMDLLLFQKWWGGVLDKKMNALFKTWEEIHINWYISHYKIISSIYNYIGKLKDINYYISMNNAKKMVWKRVNPKLRVISLVKYLKADNWIHEMKFETRDDTNVIFNEIHYLNTQKEIPDWSGYFISDQFKIEELKILNIKSYPISENLPLHLQHALGWFIDTNQTHSVAIMLPVPLDMVEIIVAPVWQKEYWNAVMNEKTQTSLGFKLKNIFAKLVDDLKSVKKYRLIAEISYKSSGINSSRIKAFERAIQMMGSAFEVRRLDEQ